MQAMHAKERIANELDKNRAGKLLHTTQWLVQPTIQILSNLGDFCLSLEKD